MEEDFARTSKRHKRYGSARPARCRGAVVVDKKPPFHRCDAHRTRAPWFQAAQESTASDAQVLHAIDDALQK